MEQGFVKPLINRFINFQKIIIKKILVYTGTMAEKSRKNFKNHTKNI